MNFRRLFLPFLVAGVIQANAEVPARICDRNGVMLAEISRKADGSVAFSCPFGAFAAHILRGLKPAQLPGLGETLYLTIDARVQMAAEQALRAVPRGAVVLLDPDNGDILAMASVPSFDANFGKDASLEKDPTGPLINRSLKAYTPGATFLPVTALAGLEAGLGDFSHECKGPIEVSGRTMKCWINEKDRQHGRQELADGMKNSCNTFFYEYAIATGPDQLAKTARKLGLGEVTGLPLNDEAAGTVPDQAYLTTISPNEKWSDGYTANTGIGQGMVLVTPLQMAVMGATLANGGTVVRPRLIDRITKADGSATVTEQMALADRLKPEYIKVVAEAMRRSVEDSDGNAQKAATPGYVVLGRTGTSQFWRDGQKDNITAFVGCAKSDEAEYAFSVFVQGAKSGGGVAAPLISRILTALKDEKLEPARLEPAKGSFDFVEALP